MKVQHSKNRHLYRFVSFLGALCLFFAAIEYLFPKPLPFFRLGLANIPILLVLDFLPLPLVAVVLLLKVFGQGLINGTLASYVFLFSLFGTIAAGIVMILVHRLGGKRISLIGVSICGALASNMVQVYLSVQFIFGGGAWLIAPVFLTFGTISGLLVGIIAEYFRKNSMWLSRIRAAVSSEKDISSAGSEQAWE
ncbi:Gx transporter family protein [Spirochaeta dissipatitropha]